MIRAASPLAFFLFAVGPILAQAPVTATGDVDATQIAETGTATLRLSLRAESPLERAYAIRIDLRRGGRQILRRDHAPPVPTQRWGKNAAIEYELPLVFRVPPQGVIAGDRIEVWLGLLDQSVEEEEDHRVVGIADPKPRADRMAKIADFVFAMPNGVPDAAAVDATVEAALALAPKDPAAAWDRLEFLFRRLDDYPLKAKLQKALLTVGRTPAPAMTFEERAIVDTRIRDERARYLRQIAGRLSDRGKLFGALLLLDEVGGSLQEDADRAVIDSLGEAKRTTRDRDGIAAKVFALSKEQEAELADLTAKVPTNAERIEQGTRMAKDRNRRAVGRALVQTVEGFPNLKERAIAARQAIEKEWLADVPAEDRAEADAAMNHPCWARTATRTSHRFLLIGPKQLIDGIPPDSLLRFDLAYLYLTDLFGRVPNPEGDRVTVYWKELFEFGGGIGGGKIVDIGNADPNAKDTRADTGLLFHELTHCVDDTSPVYGGMREGLADFGAVFAQMELGQAGVARAGIGLAARAFLQDYLERDLEYWRIPNYGPSAGFFLHFTTTYGKSGEGFRWQLWRKFFRDYRESPVDDARTPTLARAFAFHLTEAFGEAAFADLIRFRWPLVPGDLEAVRREQIAATKKSMGPTFDDMPGSPVPRDRLAKQLADEDAGVEEFGKELAVVRDWWVIGPFRRDGVDPDQFRFPPELEIDLKARYESLNNNPTWHRPGNKPVTVEPSGWLEFWFAYMDDTATYALTHATVDRDVTAWFHLRADDDVTLFVDDEFVGKHGYGTGKLGPWRPDWRVKLPDAARFAVALKKGRHKVLVKVRNGGGPSGCTLAIAQQNGLPMPGLTTDAEPPAKKLAAIDFPDGKKWPQRFRLAFDQGGAHRKLESAVGKWRVRNGALEGFDDGKAVEWRKYTVRPGFPKDSPSNLTWLPEKATEHLDAFALTIELAAGNEMPKACVIVQGDGARDALSGWTLILEPWGDKLNAHLERYDLRVHTAEPMAWDFEPKKPVKLEMTYFGKRLSVRLGERVLFDQAPLLPIPGRTRIGIATWNDRLRIGEIELRGPVRTK